MSKKNKRRHCPALGREITSQECGADRISRIACPADCAFNTFSPANYDDFQELEKRVIQKTQGRLVAELGPERSMRFADRLEAAGDDEHQGHHLHMVELHLKRDHEGRGFFDRWEAEGWKGLNNDERIIARAHHRVRPALLEIQCVRDSISMQAVDLLNPGSAPLVVVDEALTRQARRFMTLLTWLYEAPHFLRISGSGRIIEPLGPCNELETVEEIARHLGGPAGLEGLPEWLAHEQPRMIAAYVATGKARWADSMKRIDAKAGKADYRVKGSFDKLAGALESQPDIEDADLTDEDWDAGFERRFDVLDTEKERAAPKSDARMVLGTLTLARDRLRAEATGAERFARLKQRVKAVAGGQVEFLREKVEDLAGQLLAQRTETWDPSLVPPRLLEQPMILDLQSQRLPMEPGKDSLESVEVRTMRAMIAALPDTPVPKLNNLTPRAAAAIPSMRPVLIELMKGHVLKCDDLRLRRGLDVDINPALEELGLHEIVFPPPPLREIPEGEIEEEDDEDAEDWEDDEPPPDFALDTVLNEVPPSLQKEWLRPPLRAVLSVRDLDKIAEQLLQDFRESETSLLEWFAEEWPELHAMLEGTMPHDVTSAARYLLLHHAAAAARALFHDRIPDEGVLPVRLAFFVATEARNIHEAALLEDGEEFEARLCEGPQPHLLQSLFTQLMSIGDREPELISGDDMLWMMPVLRAVVRELCMLPPR